MKPPIEYRPKPKVVELRPAKRLTMTRQDIEAFARSAGPIPKGPEPTPEFIVIRRDRAKYNAYMRAYRAKKKAGK